MIFDLDMDILRENMKISDDKLYILLVFIIDNFNKKYGENIRRLDYNQYKGYKRNEILLCLTNLREVINLKIIDINKIDNEIYNGEIDLYFSKNIKGNLIFINLLGIKEINGNLIIQQNTEITSLEGACEEINVYFSCEGNRNLKYLIGGPKKVNGFYYCDGFGLVSLKGLALEISGVLYCIYGNNFNGVKDDYEYNGEYVKKYVIKNNIKVKNIFDVDFW